jgi:peptide/nickel transport system substrate-binding protein
VFDSYFPDDWQKTNSAQFRQVVKGWATATTMRDYIAAKLKSEFFEEVGKKVPFVEGIDGTGKTTKDFKGNDLGAEHEVLKITIDGVDPKAIWNFGFTVAPMNYYSTTNYNGKDYIASFNPAAGEFGLEFGDFNFMQTVINAPEKVGLPVGAGVYKAAATSSDGFFNNNMVYYERNPYFETLGSGIENAKIKYLRYKVVESDQIINSLANGDIDFGDPSATTENIGILDGKGVSHKEIYTNGYGYVGINARFIPDVVVRRAIIKAMDKNIIKNNYYKGGLADIIERPMSNTSYYYPDEATVYTSRNGTSYAYDALGNDIKAMIEAEDYVLNANGIYTKELAGFGTVTLDYTFTIAGASKDHPAMAMFENAANILNKIGFKIKVVNSQTALSDLATGKLTVWAAAWSSSIDPDMYQVYHIDSLASSTSNWGYKQIKAGSTTAAYGDEYALITELSEYIDAGRETTVKEERKEIYSDALDLIMELAVEMPTYQRKDMSAWNGSVIDESSMTAEKDLTPLNGLLARMWELNYD